MLQLLLVAALAMQAPQPATIEGRVVDSVTGDPVSRAAVTLLGASAVGVRLISVKTNADDSGKFSVEVTPGTYRGVAQRDGFVNLPGPRSLVTVTAGNTSSPLTLKLTRQAEIIGTVTGENGKPLENTMVQALRWRLFEHRRVLMPQAQVQANEQGEYHLRGLVPGDYVVMATLPGRSRRTVEPHKPTGMDYAATYFPDVSDPAAAHFITVAGGATRQAIDIHLRKIPVFRITGRIRGSIPREFVNPPSLLLVLRNPLVHYDGFQYRAHIAADQTFEFPSIPTGSYLATLAQLAPAGQPNADRVQIDVGTRDVQNVVLTMQPAPALKGRIRGEGVDFDKLMVTLHPRQTNPHGPTVGHASFLGDVDIRYVFPDTYHLRITGLPPNYYVEKAIIGSTEVTDLLDLNAGVGDDLFLKLGKGTAALNGRVADRDQQPLADAPVVLFNRRNEIVKSVLTDVRGNYLLDELAPGEYRLAAGYLDLADPDAVERLASKAQAVTLARSGREQRQLETAIQP
jgi:hypothetical protein